MVEYYTRVKQSICQRYRPPMSGGAGSSDAGPLGGSGGSLDEVNRETIGDQFYGLIPECKNCYFLKRCSCILNFGASSPLSALMEVVKIFSRIIH